MALRHPRLEPTDRPVGEVTHQASDEAGQVGRLGQLVLGEDPPQRIDRRPFLDDRALPLLFDRGHQPFLPYLQPRAIPQIGVAAPPLTALDRFEKEGVGGGRELEKGGDGRFGVAPDLAIDRNEISLGGEPGELGILELAESDDPARAFLAFGNGHEWASLSETAPLAKTIDNAPLIRSTI